MRIIDNIRLAPDAGAKEIEAAIIQRVGGLESLFKFAKTPLEWLILRKSIDSRRQQPVLCLRVGVLEEGEVKPTVTGFESLRYTLKFSQSGSIAERVGGRPVVAGPRPMVVGTGPAGIFAALVLAEAGLCPLVIEQGEAVLERARSVEAYWEQGDRALNPYSNVQFGEGGAGTFSDGKLNTGTKSRFHRLILESFVRAGAPEKILYEAKPHLGTDVLRIVMPRLRRRIIDLGGEVRFNTELLDLNVDGAELQGAVCRSHPSGRITELELNHLILAPGHSARKLVAQLYERGVALVAKDFAVGVRVEHAQEVVDQSLYGKKNRKLYPQLPAASYKLVSRIKGEGRSVYSFCMCPGGQVVASASGRGQVVTNGMSYSDRSGNRANSALLVPVRTEDLTAYARFSGDPLAGFAFQADLESKAFLAAGGAGLAPAQSAADFLLGRPAEKLPPTSYRPGTRPVALCDFMPAFVSQALALALPRFAGRFSDLTSAETVLIGPETRSSSPVRLLRDPQTGESNISGIFPAGEGAGYAGGIMSAAADGVRAGLALCQSLGLFAESPGAG